MTSRRQSDCLILGITDHPELRGAVAWLETQFRVSQLSNPTIERLGPYSDRPFELLVLAEMRPGQFSDKFVETLHRRWPLAAVVSLFGNWCEGQSRSGRVFPGVWRIAAASFVSRMGRFLRAGATGHSPLMTEADRLLDELKVPLPKSTGLIAIASNNYSNFEAIADAVQSVGYSAAWQAPQDPPVLAAPCAAILDMVRSDEADWQALGQFATHLGSIPMIVLVTFPRTEDFQRADRLQGNLKLRPKIVILGKPVRLTELVDELVGAIGTTDSKVKTAGLKSA